MDEILQELERTARRLLYLAKKLDKAYIESLDREGYEHIERTARAVSKVNTILELATWAWFEAGKEAPDEDRG